MCRCASREDALPLATSAARHRKVLELVQLKPRGCDKEAQVSWIPGTIQPVWTVRGQLVSSVRLSPTGYFASCLSLSCLLYFCLSSTSI